MSFKEVAVSYIEGLIVGFVSLGVLSAIACVIW